MLTRIGSTPPAGDIVDLLLECHARIRTFSELALKLAEADAPSPAEIVDAASRVRRYFEEALPLHALDEEESVLPRLAGRDPEVDRALRDMHREHSEHGEVLDRVASLCATLAREPERHPELRAALTDAAAALRAHFQQHLAPEEEIVFPAIRRLVPESARKAMMDELRARRAPPGGGQSSR